MTHHCYNIISKYPVTFNGVDLITVVSTQRIKHPGDQTKILVTVIDTESLNVFSVGDQGKLTIRFCERNHGCEDTLEQSMIFDVILTEISQTIPYGKVSEGILEFLSIEHGKIK